MTDRGGGGSRFARRAAAVVLVVSAVVGSAVAAPRQDAEATPVWRGVGVRTAITAGEAHACALTSAGGIRCWGGNVFGELGDGTQMMRLVPTDVARLSSGVRTIDAGGYHTCAVTEVGGALCWGVNSAGQLGDGSRTPQPVPIGVSGLDSRVRAVTAGTSHSCALLSGGAVRCWGLNDLGQLGDGTTVDRETPVDVAGLGSGVRAVTAGGHHTCALIVTGAVVCWGGNRRGQLGDGTTVDRSVPTPVVGLSSRVTQVGASVDDLHGGGHTCALTTSGAVLCWGGNDAGELGDGTFTDRLVPGGVTGLASGVRTLAMGRTSTCALTRTAGALCWGRNPWWPYDSGSTAPSPVAGLTTGLAELAGGGRHWCGLSRRGEVLCWGTNESGQLGDGTQDDHLLPVDVSGSFHRTECPTLVAGPFSDVTLTNGDAVRVNQAQRPCPRTRPVRAPTWAPT